MMVAGLMPKGMRLCMTKITAAAGVCNSVCASLHHKGAVLGAT